MDHKDGGTTTTFGGGTAISGGGTPNIGGGAAFRPLPAEFNHCYTGAFRLMYANRSLSLGYNLQR